MDHSGSNGTAPYHRVSGPVGGAMHGSMRFVLKHKWKFFVLMLLALLYVNYTATATAVLVVFFMTLLASFSTIYKMKVKFSFGFELVTLSTVIVTILYGPWVGALVGFISALAAEIIPQMIDPSSFPWILATALSAFIVYALWSIGVRNLLALGLVSFFIQIAISEPIRIFGPPEVKMQGFLYIITGLIWNTFVFGTIAPLVYSLLA